ncbi:MAG: hypothetical protein HYR84_16270 [Planctomycetes bacterium]|nr:hypothetical protein [Planctomycetota bacterium]
MIRRQPRYSPEEFARRGTEVYESKIRPLVELGNIGRIVCIDIESGEYAISDDTLEAAQILIDKNPDAQIWCVRIGHVAVEKFGFGDTREQR